MQGKSEAVNSQHKCLYMEVSRDMGVCALNLIVVGVVTYLSMPEKDISAQV